METETKRTATVLTVVMVSVILLVANPTFCFAGQVDYAKQAAMADEAIKHVGAHYLFASIGMVGDTTPAVWYGAECDAWKENHQISCIGVRHFDCSGFVLFCANAVGYNLPRYGALEIYTEAPIAHVSPYDVCKGTIVFIGDASLPIYHVAIYVGNGQIVECGGNYRNDVHIASWSSWLNEAKKGYVVAGNLLYPSSSTTSVPNNSSNSSSNSVQPVSESSSASPPWMSNLQQSDNNSTSSPPPICGTGLWGSGLLMMPSLMVLRCLGTKRRIGWRRRKAAATLLPTAALRISPTVSAMPPLPRRMPLGQPAVRSPCPAAVR